MYKVRITEEAEKSLKSIPKRDQSRILKKIAKLRQDPRPDEVTKLRGRDALYRLRQGDWRIICRIEDAKTPIATQTSFRVDRERHLLPVAPWQGNTLAFGTTVVSGVLYQL